ncbi:MAG: hypothetical protein ACJ8D5_06720 [Sphingomicrobium sp.]
MSIEKTVKTLLAGAAAPVQCAQARAEWVRRTGDAWLEAHRALDDRLGKAVEHLSEEEFERLCDAEFARVDAMMAQLRAAVDQDKWPRELYWGGI